MYYARVAAPTQVHAYPNPCSAFVFGAEGERRVLIPAAVLASAAAVGHDMPGAADEATAGTSGAAADDLAEHSAVPAAASAAGAAAAGAAGAANAAAGAAVPAHDGAAAPADAHLQQVFTAT